MSILCPSAEALPLYARWDIALLLVATALCGVVALVSLAREGWRLLRRREETPTAGEGASRDYSAVGFALLSLLILLNFGVQPALTHMHPMERPAAESFTPADFFNNAVVLIILSMCYVALKPQREAQRARLRSVCGLAALTLAGSFLFNLLYTQSGLFELITESTGSAPLQDTMQLLSRGDALSRVLLILSAVVIAPIGEECCIRGILYSALKRRVGTAAGIALSSFFFGAIHMSLGHTLPLAVFAALLCLLYEKTRTLRSCIIAHACFNALNIALLFLGSAL